MLIESKRDIRAKLGGASPDFADALVMAIAPGADLQHGCAGLGALSLLQLQAEDHVVDQIGDHVIHLRTIHDEQ